MALLEDLEVEMEESNMSFSISIDKGRGYEWGTRNGVSSLFAQKNNILDLSFWQMIREITKFNHDVTEYVLLKNNTISSLRFSIIYFLLFKYFKRL